MGLLVMVAFLIMVTETDCKAANKYEYMEAAKPVYMKKLLRVSRSLEEEDEVDEDDDDGSGADGNTNTGRQLCCCPDCLSSCSCCCA